MRCDMCGSEGALYKALIEYAELNVCIDCSRFGKVIETVKENVGSEIKKSEKNTEDAKKEILDVIAEYFADKIKNKREQLGLTQEDFAKKINEKESMVHKLETGIFVPPLGLARKLEKLLHIKLVERHEENYEKSAKGKNDTFTIGDFVKMKGK